MRHIAAAGLRSSLPLGQPKFPPFRRPLQRSPSAARHSLDEAFLSLKVLAFSESCPFQAFFQVWKFKCLEFKHLPVFLDLRVLSRIELLCLVLVPLQVLRKCKVIGMHRGELLQVGELLRLALGTVDKGFLELHHFLHSDFPVLNRLESRCLFLDPRGEVLRYR